MALIEVASVKRTGMAKEIYNPVEEKHVHK